MPSSVVSKGLAFILIFAAAPAFAQGVKEGDAIAIVIAVKGEAEAFLSGSRQGLRASAGLSLRAGDEVRTKDDATVTIVLKDDRKMRLMSNSSLLFTAETAKKGGSGSSKGDAIAGLWKMFSDKFRDSRDISAAKGVVGALRTAKKALQDKPIGTDAEESLKALVAVIREEEDEESSLHFMLAIANENAGQYGKAEAEYLAAIDLSPGEGRLYDALGALYVKAKATDSLLELKERKLQALGRE